MVNVDVSNSCFWHESLISQLGMEICGQTDMSRFIQSTQPLAGGAPGPGIKILKRLAKNQFTVKHRGQAPGAGESISIPT